MERVTEFLEICFAGILFCDAVWLALAQLHQFPGHMAWQPEMGFEVVREVWDGGPVP